MKRLNIWLCSMLLLCITACEKDLPVFEDPDCLLNFNYGSQLSTEEVTEMMRNGSHSFKLKTPEGQLSDTVWLDVDIMGKLSAEDRPLALQQVMVEGTKNAVAGTHYIAFDDPVLAEFYVVPAHSATAHIPVIPSMQAQNRPIYIFFIFLLFKSFILPSPFFRCKIDRLPGITFLPDVELILQAFYILLLQLFGKPPGQPLNVVGIFR